MELTLAQIAEFVEGDVEGDNAIIIRGVAPFESARPDQITFARDAKFLKRLEETQAQAIIVPREVCATSKTILRVDNPLLAVAGILRRYHPLVQPESGISPLACIGEGTVLGQDVRISAYVQIDADVRIGSRVVIHPGAVIGRGAVVGDESIVYPNVTIREGCRIGRRVIIHAGSVIGSDGFGFVPDRGRYYKIPHIGTVEIGDDVEIGACNTIDRAMFGKTQIARGVKTDNLVHIAHNVTVGEDSVIVAQVGISGSVSIGGHAILAGQAGISGHLSLGDNVTVGPQAGVGKSIASGQTVSGSPALPHRLWLRVQRLVARLPDLNRKLGELEKRLQRIEAQHDD